jgi:hypothetical protein
VEYANEMALCGTINTPSFVKINAGVLRFYLRNSRGCNDSITDRGEL